MRFGTKTAAVLAAAALAFAGGCQDMPERTDRWTTTENTNVPIDFDKVNKAYEQAEGPEDFERRVNEIYEGDEIVSVAVRDEGDKAQVVTGFFDKNKSGQVEEGEEIFTIRRVITAEGEGQYSTQGYGPYAYYHSPVMSIVSGMLLGSMISNAFSPRYVPVAYTTSSARVGELHNHRSQYRAQNPGRWNQGPKSKTGRSYGGGKRSTGGGRIRGGGGRFGLHRAGRTVRPVRLTA